MSSTSRSSMTTTRMVTVTVLAVFAAQAAMAAAPQELQALQGAETAAVASLFKRMNTSSAMAAAAVPQLTETVGNTTITVALLTPAAATGDGPVTLVSAPEPNTIDNAGQDEQLKVAVSPATLSQILGSSPRGVVLSMARLTYDLGGSMKAADAATTNLKGTRSEGVDNEGGRVAKQLSAQPISVNLKDLHGNPIHLTFEEPLNISMGVNIPGAFECAFWNDTLNTWSKEGVFPVVREDGSAVCATTHLSLFAMFEKSVASITCLTFDLLNNFDRFFSGAWIPRLGSLSFLVAILMQVALVVLGIVRDRQNARFHDLHDLFIQDHDPENFSLIEFILFNAQVFGYLKFRPRRRNEANRQKESVSDKMHRIYWSVAERAADMVLLQTMSIVLGHKAGLHGIDMQLLINAREKKMKNYLLQTTSGPVQKGLTFLRFRGQHEFDLFCKQGILSKTWTLFKSLEVYSMISQRFSLFMTSQTLANIFALRFILSLGLACVFYYTESAAEDLDPALSCAPKDYGLLGDLLRGALVAAVVSIPSSILMWVFATVSMRNFVAKKAGIHDKRQKWTVRRWATVEFVSNILQVSLLLFLILFICLILASISPTDDKKWAICFFLKFAQIHVLLPGITAAVMAMGATVAQIEPETRAQVREELGRLAKFPEKREHQDEEENFENDEEGNKTGLEDSQTHTDLICDATAPTKIEEGKANSARRDENKNKVDSSSFMVTGLDNPGDPVNAPPSATWKESELPRGQTLSVEAQFGSHTSVAQAEPEGSKETGLSHKQHLSTEDELGSRKSAAQVEPKGSKESEISRNQHLCMEEESGLRQSAAQAEPEESKESELVHMQHLSMEEGLVSRESGAQAEPEASKQSEMPCEHPWEELGLRTSFAQAETQGSNGFVPPDRFGRSYNLMVSERRRLMALLRAFETGGVQQQQEERTQTSAMHVAYVPEVQPLQVSAVQQRTQTPATQTSAIQQRTLSAAPKGSQESMSREEEEPSEPQADCHEKGVQDNSLSDINKEQDNALPGPSSEDDNVILSSEQDKVLLNSSNKSKDASSEHRQMRRPPSLASRS